MIKMTAMPHNTPRMIPSRRSVRSCCDRPEFDGAAVDVVDGEDVAVGKDVGFVECSEDVVLGLSGCWVCESKNLLASTQEF